MKSKKLNVMKTRPEISDEEIRSMMDFNKVLELHKSSRRWKYIPPIAGVCLVIGAIVGWLMMKPVDEKIPATVTVTVTPQTQKEIKPAEVVAPKPAEVKDKKAKKETTPQPDQTPDVYTEAEPVNGYEDLYAYFEKELKYPSHATPGVEGDVTVTFVLNRDGKPEQIKFLNSLGPEFDEEVIRVIDYMPAWKPATQNGKPVPAKISQVFTFSIKN